MFGNGGTPRATARRFASCVRSAVTRRWYSATAPSIVAESHRAGACRRGPRRRRRRGSAPPACSTRSTTSRCTAQRADEPVEVGDDDDVGLAGLDQLDRAPQAGPLRERRAAGDVELLDRLDELEPVALARGADTLGLLGRADEPLAVTVADAGDADDADGATRGGR